MDTSSSNNPFKCTLNVTVPRGKGTKFQKIICPFMTWIDPTCRMIQTFEGKDNKCQSKISHPQVNVTSISVPAISIMLFLNEYGPMSAANMQNFLKRRPWQFNHRVELHSKRTPNHAIAFQEFYKLSEDLPLWSVCPIHCGNEHFRILLNVRDFKRMVEFYRIITDVEKESSKPGFCIFQLYSQPGLDIQLALKHSKHTEPCPVDRAVLVFQVVNIEAIKSIIFSDISKLEDSNNRYSVRDPDGNLIILEQIFPQNPEPILNVQKFDNRNRNCTDVQHSRHVSKSNPGPILLRCDSCSKKSEDLKSFKSSSDSQDSGRCSDSDIWCSEVEHTRANKYCAPIDDALCSDLLTRSTTTIPQNACNKSGLVTLSSRSDAPVYL